MRSQGIPLTDVERAIWAYDRASPMNMISYVTIGALVDPTALALALEEVARFHPYAGFAVEEEDVGPVFVPWSGPRTAVELLPPGADPSFLIQEYLNLSIDLAKPPLIRLLLCQPGRDSEGFILFCMSHLIGDGISLNAFFREVLDRLCGAPLPSSPAEWKRPSSIDFMPGADTPIPARSEASGRFQREEPLEPGIEVSAATPARRCEFHSFQLQAREEELFKTAQRTTGLPENGILSASLQYALERHILSKYEGFVESPWFKLSTGLNLRRRMKARKLEPQDLGMWAGRMVLHAQRSSGSSFVEYARAYNSFFREAVVKDPCAFIRILAGPPLSISPLSISPLSISPLSISPAALSKPQGIRPHIKITSVGELSPLGLRLDSGGLDIRSSLIVTPLHRGFVGDFGLGLTSASICGRFSLGLQCGEGAFSAKAMESIKKDILSCWEEAAVSAPLVS